ncbi:MAG TPA: MFS transporter [Steroidobacteraceae bacterium]|jgi:DHA2 family methylenomycin A resistance protein-like MFS transporter
MPHKTQALTLAAMSLGFGVVQLDVTIVNTALTTIGSGLQADTAALQWVVNAYTIGLAAFILTAGALGDRIGAKRVFIAGFALFTAASVGCALAPSLGALIAARGIQGVGAAVLVPNSLALLNHAYADPAERGRAVGFWAAGASVALTAGPLAGGLLIHFSNWRAIFLVNLPIGLVGLFLTWRYAEETPPKQNRRLDLPGQAFAMLALGLLAASIIEGGKAGWHSRFVEIAAVLAVILSVAFILQERRYAQPMLPLELFSQRPVWLSVVVGLLVNTAFYGLIFVLSLYFQKQHGLSPLQTGLAFLPMMAVVLPFNILGPRLSERFGAAAVIALGAVIAAAGAGALFVIGKQTPYVLLCAQFLALGGGLGLLVPPLTSMLLGNVDKARSGIASGVLNSARQTGSVIGVALFGTLVAEDATFMAGLKIALGLAVGLLAASAAIAIAARDKR